MSHRLEYLWLDGCNPTQIRSKTKIVERFDTTGDPRRGSVAPVWGFDGSSTNQAEGSDSDCVLQPIRIYPNPLHYNSSIVLCEVYDVNFKPHASNTRHTLELTLTYLDNDPEEWVGFEQEYTLYDLDTSKPYGWPTIGEPPPQGDYYCGRNAGEEIMTAHTDLCLEAGIRICGTNAEVMLGQWEYQIGPGGSLEMSDDLWVARWLLEKVCYNHNVTVSLDPKPIEGDWNGAGCHTNFSTKQMREEGGSKPIFKACTDLEKVHKEHMKEYGEGNDRRLTGLHETQDINTFSWGVSDRGASIRIPWQVDQDGRGYLEDRRPSSNCDPYRVSKKLIETICN